VSAGAVTAAGVGLDADGLGMGTGTGTGLDLDLGVTPAAVSSADDHTAPRAQAIHCGGVHVAVPYSWARAVVEQFDLAPVPNAPPWLAGAANVEGRCVAVIDLSSWLTPDTPWATTAQAVQQRSRLLLGGDGDEAFALRFQGLPGMLRVDDLAPSDTPESTPDLTADVRGKLLAYVQGVAEDKTSQARLPLLDLPALAQTWAHELAL
jgi:chemotaxis signal transduction protein